MLIASTVHCRMYWADCSVTFQFSCDVSMALTICSLSQLVVICTSVVMDCPDITLSHVLVKSMQRNTHIPVDADVV